MSRHRQAAGLSRSRRPPCPPSCGRCCAGTRPGPAAAAAPAPPAPPPAGSLAPAAGTPGPPTASPLSPVPPPPGDTQGHGGATVNLCPAGEGDRATGHRPGRSRQPRRTRRSPRPGAPRRTAAPAAPRPGWHQAAESRMPVSPPTHSPTPLSRGAAEPPGTSAMPAAAPAAQRGTAGVVATTGYHTPGPPCHHPCPSHTRITCMVNAGKAPAMARLLTQNTR